MSYAKTKKGFFLLAAPYFLLCGYFFFAKLEVFAAAAAAAVAAAAVAAATVVVDKSSGQSFVPPQSISARNTKAVKPRFYDLPRWTQKTLHHLFLFDKMM